jgi:hypothetical protein
MPILVFIQNNGSIEPFSVKPYMVDPRFDYRHFFVVEEKLYLFIWALAYEQPTLELFEK